MQKSTIMDTDDGECMRLRVSRDVEAMPPISLNDDHHILQSTVAPTEPHEFDAELRLISQSMTEELSFRMVEPEGHHH